MMDRDQDRVVERNPRSTAVIGRHPIHPMLIPFPIVCFVGAFVTDLLYASYGDGGFADASKWLLGFGLVTAAAAAIAGLTDYMGDDRIRQIKQALHHMIANVAAVVLSAVNFIIRLGSSDDNVLSIGIYLSGVVVLILLYSGWLGGELVYRHRVGVHDRT